MMISRTNYRQLQMLNFLYLFSWIQEWYLPIILAYQKSQITPFHGKLT